MVDQKEAEEYVQQLFADLEKNPKKLSPRELRLMTRVKQGQEKANETAGQIGKMRDQVAQLTAQIRSLELQHQGELGRASGLLDSLVDDHFASDVKEVDAKPKPKAKTVKSS